MSTKVQKLAPWALFVGIFGLALALAFWGLSGEVVHAEGDAAPSADVLARVGDSDIMLSDVEDRVAAELVKVRTERYNALQSGLNAAVSDRLVELEAAARGMTKDELVEAEVQSKVVEATEEEIDAFYEERKAQIRAAKEQVLGQIKQYIEQQQGQELYQDFITSLEAKYGVERFLEPPRFDVAADGFPSKGSEAAPVTIVEFSDFQCPYCSRVNPSIDRVLENYGERVRVVFRQFPLNSIHPEAQKAAEASLCADAQGKFWEMHDVMFEEQKSLGVDQLKEKAARLGLDAEAFGACLDSDEYAEAVAADLRSGASMGVTGTPAMFINGRFLNGAVPYEQLAAIVDEELARQGGK